MQLVVKGPQDFFLTNKPEFTYFKNVFKRYVNFSKENIKVLFSGKQNFGETIKCKLTKNGDLIKNMYLKIILEENNTKTWGYVKKLGFAIIKNITLMINNETVETHTGKILNMIHELEKNNGQNSNFDKMIGNVNDMTKISENHNKYSLYIPLKFWFCKFNSLALPIVCLKNNMINISVTFNEAINCINYKGNTVPTDLPEIKSVYLLTDYILLENDELNKYKVNKHEYLIEQYNTNKFNITSYNQINKLKFGHQCKSIHWLTNQTKFKDRTSYLAWALDNDWSEAKNIFAKLIWLATRDGLSADGLTISYNPTTYNPGDSPSLISSGNTLLENLISKVDAYILFYDTTTVDATTENVALIRNDLTFEDMTLTIDELKNDANNTTNQSTFFDLHKINIIDIFNHGNFVDGSDNPIISSNLKINGHSIFNLSGLYFNNIKSFYDYKNSPSNGINSYSFAFYPSKIQPSGTYNLSKINNLTLNIKIGKDNTDDKGTYFTNNFKSGELEVYILNYNLLKIEKGECRIFYNQKKSTTN